jgi:acetylglutamate kinase
LPIVVKYGGNAMPSPGGACTDPTLFEVAQLWRAGWPIVLVHGGGPEIDAALAERGIVTDRIDGMRVTRKATLDVTEAVLCGTINKRLVRALTALGLPAVGVSGQDGASLVARVARTASGADLGYVGKIERCDARLVQTLLDAKFLPVVAPIAAAADSTTAYNVNADLAAAALAGALRASAFVAITNVRRVLRDVDDPASAIERLTPAQARVFADSAACRSGMKPKLHAAALAAAGGTVRSFICGAEPGSISAAMFAGDATIVASEHL